MKLFITQRAIIDMLTVAILCLLNVLEMARYEIPSCYLSTRIAFNVIERLCK